MIRTAHAVRALRDEPTAVRLEELALALAYCAARYRTLGGTPRLSGGLDLETAVSKLPVLDPDIDRRGAPPQIVSLLDERPDFTAAVNTLAPPTDVRRALIALAGIGARVYLQGASRHPLVLLHAVTGPAAVHLLVADASTKLGRVAFSYIWQAVAAWAVAFGNGLPRHEAEPAAAAWDEIAARAVALGDEHAIKLTEACSRLDRLAPSGALRTAAEDWVDRLADSRTRSPGQLIEAGITTRLAAARGSAPTENPP